MPPRHTVRFKKKYFPHSIAGPGMYRSFCALCKGLLISGTGGIHTCYTCGQVICYQCAIQDTEHTPWGYSRHYCKVHDPNHFECHCPLPPVHLSAHFGNKDARGVSLQSTDEDTTCSICTMQGGEVYRSVCGHVFHEDCLARWQVWYDSSRTRATANHRTCPICRSVLF